MRVGTDIIQISRIAKSIESRHFVESVFTENEQAHCKSAQSYAGLFAAKEAYLKAVGTGISCRLNTIEILHTDNGKPYINGVSKCDISISHDGNYAIAVCIME
ncbi:MAG: holo-ACP synthase [Eubacterium sp.]